MVTFLRSFSVQAGMVGAETTSETPEDLYVSPEELNSLYGCAFDASTIRAVMTLIHAYCNRSSLWPTEIDTGAIEVPPDRQETRLPVTPVLGITSMTGRYGLGRRDHQGWNAYTSNVAAYLMLVGSQQQWSPIDVNTVAFEPSTGVCWIPNSFVLARWAHVRVIYLAGFVTIPDRVKLAIVEIATNMHTKGVSDRTRYSVGRVSRSYASDSFITKTAASLLAPYVVQTYL